MILSRTILTTPLGEMLALDSGEGLCALEFTGPRKRLPRLDARLERHCAQVLDIPYNAFSAIRLDKWKDGRNRERVERVLPQVADIASRMGYAAD